LGEQLLEPARVGLRVVVEERHDFTGRRSNAGVASAGKSPSLIAGPHLHVVGERELRSAQQLLVVIDDHDALLGEATLGSERVKRAQQ
jgi:hypothetical protein